jgi:hypothetical protein
MPEAPEGGHMSQAGTPLVAGAAAPDPLEPPLAVAAFVARAPEGPTAPAVGDAAAAVLAAVITCDADVGRRPSVTTPLRITLPGVAAVCAAAGRGAAIADSKRASGSIRPSERIAILSTVTACRSFRCTAASTG